MKRFLSVLLTLSLVLSISVFSVSAAEPDSDTASETPLVVTVMPFTDVQVRSAYYTKPVLWAYYHDPQITAGTSSTTFSPRSSCTRAQVVTFLWRYAGSPAPAGTGTAFTDVSPDAYYYDAILWASEQGIARGYSDGTFRPENTITRAQMAVFLHRFAGGQAPDDTGCAFTDVSPDAYYYDDVLWAAGNGITYGKTATAFAPNDTCIRAEVVTFLYRYAGEPAVELPPCTHAYQAVLTPATYTSQGFTTYTCVYCGDSYVGDVTPVLTIPEDRTISWNSSWTYANESQIHDSDVTLYYSHAANRTGIVVAVNAGHGTYYGSAYRTYCHPDHSAKVTGGSTAAGSITAAAISEGTVLGDGTYEATATLSLALLVKDRLLAAGYDVLMLRENDNTRLDNIARTVFANNNADCHISLHYDSTTTDKGFYYISVPDVSSYRSMEPVASHWPEHIALGDALLSGARTAGVKIYSSGSVPLDLTQTSYSTIPSVDVEVGDRGSSHSEATQSVIADGIVLGVQNYFAGKLCLPQQG